MAGSKRLVWFSLLPPAAAQFWARAERGAGCWLWQWQVSAGPDVYPTMRLDSTHTLSAKQIAYVLARGPIPVGLEVCHTCDNRHCVNPTHLWLGTHQQNMLDMVAKGRHGGRQRKAAHTPTPPARDAPC